MSSWVIADTDKVRIVEDDGTLTVECSRCRWMPIRGDSIVTHCPNCLEQYGWVRGLPSQIVLEEESRGDTRWWIETWLNIGTVDVDFE